MTTTIPYSVRLSYDPTKVKIEPGRINLLADILDKLIRRQYTTRTAGDRHHMFAHTPESGQNTTTEIINTHYVDSRPRIEVHVVCFSADRWPIEDDRLEVAALIHDFLDKKADLPPNTDRPMVILRWSMTNDKCYISEPPPAPS